MTSETKFPRACAKISRRIGALVYRVGPMTRKSIVNQIEAGGTSRNELFKSVDRMVEYGQLILTPAGLDIPHQFRDQWAEVAGFGKKPTANTAVPAPEPEAPYVGEIVPPRTCNRMQGTLSAKYIPNPYGRREGSAPREVSFVALASNVEPVGFYGPRP